MNIGPLLFTTSIKIHLERVWLIGSKIGIGRLYPNILEGTQLNYAKQKLLISISKSTGRGYWKNRIW